MNVWRDDPRNWPDPVNASAVTIGVFDGVHLGHQAVLASLVAKAGIWTSAVVTFDPHPRALITPGAAPRLITTLGRRIELIGQAGIQRIAVVPFGERIRNLSPDEFCQEVLAEGLRARLVVVGADFHFGRNRSGSVEVLRRLGDHFGFEVAVIDLLSGGSGVVSSTMTRQAIAEGRMEEASEMLGRPFDLTGLVVEGAGRGQQLGFPTANLAVPPELVFPGRGVYAAEAVLETKRFPAVVNVGVRPTFEGTAETVEAHVLDFEGSLYGSQLGLEFVSRIRDEMKFANATALAEQIERDTKRARKLLGV